MMSLAFLKKAFGIKRTVDEKDLEDFLKTFDPGDVSNPLQLLRIHKKKSFRFMVLKNEGRHIVFDSSHSKDSQKSLPTFSIGSQQFNIFDIVFGSYSLSTSKDLLFSIKIHDLSSYGYLLITRVVTDIDEWRSAKLCGKRSYVKRPNISSSVPQFLSRSETAKSLAACLLINIEISANPVIVPTSKVGNLSGALHNRRNTSLFVSEERQTGSSPSQQRQLEICARRFYCMLFEHSAQLSVLVENLVDTTFSTICRTCRGHWGVSVPLSEVQCVEIIAKSYSQFLLAFRDFCTPKLNFPLWTTFNNILAHASGGIASIVMENSHLTRFGPWLNTNSEYLTCSEYGDDSLDATYDAFTTLFLRNCLVPLLSRGGKENRYFLYQLVTGILTLYPGWVSNLTNTQLHQNAITVPVTPLHSSGCTSTLNILLDQLLTQGGCLNLNLESLGGAIFNCTVLSGQSRKYLLALLYFTTYFLRFTSLLSSNESVPDLGRADLFELEQQRRRSRMNSKTRRKSGSAVSVGGDAPDSGISSQEDLTASMYSASTGSSPTHASGMALCMPHRLTRDQCRIAEAAAQMLVWRETSAAAAAAAAAAASNTIQSSVLTMGPCAPTPVATRLPTETVPGTDSSNVGTAFGTASASVPRYTEIPLLIEKFVEEQSDQCACVTSELFPGQNPLCTSNTLFQSALTNHTQPSPTATSLFSLRPISDSTPALPTGLPSSQTSSPTSGSSPRFNAASVGAAQSSQAELARGGHLLGMGHVPASFTLPASGLAYESFGQPAANSVTNHNLIGATVSDHFCSGLILQATSEQPDSFRDRLEEQLNRWLRLGPLIIRGMNLSTRKVVTETQHGMNRTVDTRIHGKTPQWYACGLLVNTDNKTVEVLTVRQSGPRDSVGSVDLGAVETRSQQRGSRHSFSQSSNLWIGGGGGLEFGSRDPIISGSNRRGSVAPDKPRPVPIQPAPLVARLIDQTCLLFERTNCASMALRDLESGLQLIYKKSRILADLLSIVGPSLLQQSDRMTSAASCSANDLPLLLSTAASYSLPAATILHSHFTEWWFS